MSDRPGHTFTLCDCESDAFMITCPVHGGKTKKPLRRVNRARPIAPEPAVAVPPTNAEGDHR